MAITLSLKINNIEIDGHQDSIRTITPYPTITWEIISSSYVSVDNKNGTISDEILGQFSYDIRISNVSFNIGTDSFSGNRLRTRPVIIKDRFWTYFGI